MSRIGKKPIVIPDGVDVNVEKNKVKVSGPKGSLERTFSDKIKIDISDKTITFTKLAGDKQTEAVYGTTRALIANMIKGALSGFIKELEIVGIGYKAAISSGKLTLNLGYSHPIVVDVPKDINVAVQENTKIIISGIDKEGIGLFTQHIKKLRLPDHYKGKGVRYKGERIVLKPGKKALASK